MYYRHNGNYWLIEKSTTELEGENVLTCDEDFDLSLYDVIVGFVKDNKILKHTKKLRGVESVIRKLEEVQSAASDEVTLYATELDFRLSIIEIEKALFES